MRKLRLTIKTHPTNGKKHLLTSLFGFIQAA
jgi:hypothetical protein